MAKKPAKGQKPGAEKARVDDGYAGGDVGRKGEKRDLLAEAKEEFATAIEAEEDNRREALDDLTFARLEQQWPEGIRKSREDEKRPMHTISKMAAFIRQVVNDSRQNKPAIRTHPVDGEGDPETAKIIDGLIRSIEYQSNADVAYDTSVESAVSGGFGYFKIGIDYARDDSFDLDLVVDRVADPFTIYGDPRSKAADSSDWMTAFDIEWVKKDAFEEEYGKEHDCANWDADGYNDATERWITEDSVLVASWWKRDEVMEPAALLSDGTVIKVEALKDPEFMAVIASQGVTVKMQREIRSYKVTQRLMTAAGVLKAVDWKGKYIPIVPVYGDEVNVEGKRYFRSLIRSAKDAQRMFNYWRTTATETAALNPRAPWIGPKGFAKTDAKKWANANTANHQYLEYDGPVRPERTQFVGNPAALQEALNASDDMKAVLGIYDASLGARSNETSGKAIMARQREGDVSTFHFLDNLNRAIRHGGRILIDLIPKVYTGERMVRVLGEDGAASLAQLGKPIEIGQDAQGNAITRINDLTLGKYDLVVKSGPGYTTRREESAERMMQLIQAHGELGPLIGDLVAEAQDWPGADKIAERLKTFMQHKMQMEAQQNAGPQGPDPAIAEAMQKMQAENAQLKQANQSKQGEQNIKMLELQVKMYEAITERMKVGADIQLGIVDSLTTADEQAHAQRMATAAHVAGREDTFRNEATAREDKLRETVLGEVARQEGRQDAREDRDSAAELERERIAAKASSLQ